MVKDLLEQDLKKVISNLGFESSDMVLSISQNKSFGDYSTNIALQLAKQKSGESKQSPMDIANKILEKLENPDYLEKAEIAGPGFLNFFIKPEILKNDLLEITENFGHSDIGKGQKIVLEHTGINPNKAMHIGHLRNAVLGDALARVFSKNGYELEIQNYIDDTGIQVTDTYIGTKFLDFREQRSGERLDDYFWDLYAAVNKKYEEDPEFLKHREEVLKEVEHNPDGEIAKEVKKIATEMTQAIAQTLAEFGIYHDLYVWESDILKFKFWSQAFETLKKTPGFEKEEQGKNKGTWLVRFGESEDDDHVSDKIFVRSDGTATYTAKDFAYNLWKFGLLGEDFRYKQWDKKPGGIIYTTAFDGEKMDRFDKSDLVYTVIDERQSYLQQVIKEVFNRLGYEKQSENLHHVAYAVVTLSSKTAEALGLMLKDEKKSYAMAGRKGIGVKVRDLRDLLAGKINEEKKGAEAGLSPERIAQSAVKYYMLKYNTNTEIVFDFDQALSIYGATGPYLQYTHARVSSILEKAKDVSGDDKGYLPNDSEIELVKGIFEWPSLLGEVSKTLEPSAIATFAFDLAQKFNSFYEKNSVLNADTEDEKIFRLNLVRKFQLVYKDVLDTLGIEAPEKM